MATSTVITRPRGGSGVARSLSRTVSEVHFVDHINLNMSGNAPSKGDIFGSLGTS